MLGFDIKEVMGGIFPPRPEIDVLEAETGRRIYLRISRA